MPASGRLQNSGLVPVLGRWRGDEIQTAGSRRRVSIFAAGLEIKRPTKHVEAAIRVISGRGFNSPRLQVVSGKDSRISASPCHMLRELALSAVHCVTTCPSESRTPWDE